MAPPTVPRSPRRFAWAIRLQALAVLLLLVGAALIDLRLNHLRALDEGFTSFRGDLNQIQIALLNMQSALRGYVLAGNPEFLDPYLESAPVIDRSFAALRDSGIFAQEVAELEEDARRWRSRYAEPYVALVRAEQTAEAQRQLADGEGNRVFIALRGRAGDLRAAVIVQQQDNQGLIRLLNNIQLLIIILLASMVVLWMMMLRRFLGREDRLWADLSATSAELAASNTELQTKINESRLLSGIAEMFVTRRPAGDIYPQVAKSLGQLLNGWCGIMLRQPPPNDDLLHILAMYHPDPVTLERIQEWIAGRELRASKGLHAPLFLANEALVVVNRQDGVGPELAPDLLALADSAELTSYVAVPIVVQKQVSGLIAVASALPGHHFALEEQFFLGQIADQISLWLENTRLFQLAEQRATELQTSFDSITDIIAVYDAQGRKLRINQAGRQFLGLDEDGALPTLEFRQLNGQLLAPDEHPVRRVLRGEVVHDIELGIAGGGGAPVIHAISVAPLRSATDVIEGVVLVARDISARKELDRLKEEFVANMSHELRTPLTAILGYGELLLKRRTEALTPWHVAKIDGIRTGGQRLLALVNDLLDTARLDAGQIELHRQLIDLNELLDEQRRLLMPALQAKSLVFQSAFDSNLPPALADPDRLNQIITNLLSNAIKFTPERGEITIRTSHFAAAENQPAAWRGPALALAVPAHQPGLHLAVSVEDTGVGIAAEVMPHLWDRFYQAEGGASRRFGGTGLGLSIVKQLVELHGGQAWAASPGTDRGSAFAFTLPLAAEPPANGYPADAPEQRQPTVLVVEPDQPTADRLAAHLREAGFAVAGAASAAEALALAAELSPAAIMLDLQLPDSDGWAALAALRRHPHLAATPALVLSAAGQPPPDAEQLGGAAAFLVKPLSGERLIETIRAVLPPSGDSASSSAPVMIVDDDADLVNLLAATLHEHGFATVTAADGSLALAALQRDPLPGLILLDLMMPLVDGFQLLARIRADQRTRRIPVIVVTARDLRPDELIRLRHATQAIQLKHDLDFEALVAEVQRHVIANGGGLNG
ncbi:MAG TPA: response regulator [Herpetosiphonaceae bacterium]